MTRKEIQNHKNYNPSNHINKLWCEWDGCYYLILEHTDGMDMSRL
jgi:hypothetical protein